MARPQRYFDWHSIVDRRPPEAEVEVTHDRLSYVWIAFIAAAAIMLLRAVQLELSYGAKFRQVAAQPLERTQTLTAHRGRILARDGTPLAVDRTAPALAIQYRYLEDPPDPAWLRRMARVRVPKAQRRDRQRLAEEEAAIRTELAAVRNRLADLCQVGHDDWQARTERIAGRVSRLAEHVNARRLERFRQQEAEPDEVSEEWTVGAIAAGLFAPPQPLPPPPVTIAEQTAWHVVVERIPPSVIEEMNTHPTAYPGAKIVEHTRRDYPLGALAAQLVGHLGKPSTEPTATDDRAKPGDELVGLLGIERGREEKLRGRDGLERQWTDRKGNVERSLVERAARDGRDTILTIDARLQAGAEQLLDQAVRRLDKQTQGADGEQHSGAIVVLDVCTGEVLVAASAPRFDPNLFVGGDAGAGPASLARLLADPRRPLFDRVAKMALPPGSIFKSLTALALLDVTHIDPGEAFYCQGYLHEPDRLRCQIFRQQGIGHGDVSLSDALTQSCNVYFFHHANRLGGAALVDLARHAGFGQPSGIELPEEAAGQLPTTAQLRQPSAAQVLAVGQGALAVTPLQMARLYAAIANGGYLIEPRLLRESIEPSTESDRPSTIRPAEHTRIAGIRSESLQRIREALYRVVNDPAGTGYRSVRMNWPLVAGKTGTAESGGDHADHAWFAGYVPADAPRYAFVVALEHGGSGAEAAGAVVRQLVGRMLQLNYFGPAPAPVAERPIPPGKG